MDDAMGEVEVIYAAVFGKGAEGIAAIDLY